jgi:ribosome-binding ATPase
MLSIGIVGLPNVGKSSLFNALTDNSVLAANYPFATIEPNTGIVPIPDSRLSALSKLYNNAPIKPATVTFVDIAGLVAGASQGEGLGNQFLANIRSCNAICHVVRAFDDNNVQHVDNDHNPKKDIEVINTELVLADLQTVEKRLPVIQKEARANSKLMPNSNFLEEVKQILDSGQPLWQAPTLAKNELSDWLKKELQLLTIKPVIYVFNVSETDLNKEQFLKDLSKLAEPNQAIFVCAKIESELVALDAIDRRELLASYGASESSLENLARAAYQALGLQSFLTAGEQEVRAWTIPKNATAPKAAGVIHGDFERGFIAAQIINYNDLIEAGSEASAKAAGKMRTEGKTYIMQPDDVVDFKFNV